MKTKKLMSLVLALVMALSLAVPAFATTPTLDNTNLTEMAKIDTATTTVNGVYQAPILALTVPKKINLLLNPYGVSVTTNKDTAIEETDVQRQVVSADNLIISRSNVPIGIKATATGTIAHAEGEANKWTLAKAPIVTTGANASVKKEALVYMIFGDVDTSAITPAANVTKFMADTKAAASGSDPAKLPYEGLTIDDIDYAEPDATLSNITFADAATAKDGIIIQEGAGKETLISKSLSECSVTEGVDAQGATTYTYDTVSAVAFKMDGAMVGNPKDTSWGKDDKLTVSVAWKFVPDIQAVPLKVNEYVTTSTAVSSNIAAFITDKNASAPAFELKGNSDSTVTLTQAGVLAITSAGMAAKKGSALAVGDKLTYKLKVAYMNNATPAVEVTKNITLTVKIVDLVVAGTYTISSTSVGQIDAQAGVSQSASLSGAPSGVTVTAANGKIDVTKAAVDAANGGTALTTADQSVYIGPFTYKGNTGSADVSKVIVLKITAA